MVHIKEGEAVRDISAGRYFRNLYVGELACKGLRLRRRNSVVQKIVAETGKRLGRVYAGELAVVINYAFAAVREIFVAVREQHGGYADIVRVVKDIF